MSGSLYGTIEKGTYTYYNFIIAMENILDKHISMDRFWKILNETNTVIDTLEVSFMTNYEYHSFCDKRITINANILTVVVMNYKLDDINFVIKNGLNGCNPDFLNDSEIAKNILKIKPASITQISDELKDNNEVVIEAIKKNGLLLKYVSNRLKDDDGFVSLAIEQNANALMHASERLQNDYDILKLTVKCDYRRFQYMPEIIKTSKKIIIYVIGKSADMIKYVDPTILNDKSFILELLSINVGIYEFLTAEQKND